MRFRAQFLFWQAAYGWSETWQISRTNLLSVNDALAPAVNLADKRIKTCGDDTWLNAIRLSNPLQKRASRIELFSKTAPGPSGWQGSFSGGSCPPAVCLITRIFPATLLDPMATRGLHGVPDANVVNGVYSATGAHTTAMNNFFAQLGVDGWGWMSVDTTTTILPPIIGLTQDVHGRITYELPPGSLLAFALQRIRVRVKDVTGAETANGSHLVDVIDAAHARTVRRVPILPYTGGGVMRLSSLKFINYASDYRRERIAERKPGRPFFLSVGRRVA